MTAPRVTHSAPASPDDGLRTIRLRPLGLLAVVAGLMALLPSTGQAQTVLDDPGAAIALSDYQGAYTVGPDGRHYIIIGHQINDGVGYDGDGFTTLGGHATLYDWGTTHLFGEARAHITNQSRVGYSGLLGLRRQTGTGVLGGWVGYDNWESILGNDYGQIAAGVEALYCNVDFRANGYFVVGDDTENLGFLGKSGVQRFTGNRLVFTDPALFEEAMSGFDAEVGVPVPYAPWARVYGGIYGYDSNFDDTTIGGRGRAEVRLSNEVTVNFIGSHDDIYGDSFNVQGEYRFDGRVGNNVLLPAWSLNYRKHAPVRRNWPVATRLIEAVADRNATFADGRDLSFAVVDNTAGPAGSGDGTFENPFTSLPDAADQSVVLVRSSDADYVGNITLRDGQSLFGEGKPVVIDTNCGPISLLSAGFSDGSGRGPGVPRMGTPTIRSTGGPAITLADNNTIRGINAVAPGNEAAIFGDQVTNLALECIVATGDYGLLVNNAIGNVSIVDSQFNALGENAGVDLTTDSSLNLVMDDVSINGVGLGDGVRLTGGDRNLNLNLNDLRIDNVRNGLVAGMAGSGINARLTDIAITAGADGGSGTGFDFATLGDSLVIRGDDLSAEGFTRGASFDVDSGFVDVAVETGTFSNNLLGVEIDAEAATGMVELTGTQINGNAGDGLAATATNGSNLRVAVGDSTRDGNASQVAVNGGDNINVSSQSGSNLVLAADGVLATGAGQDAIAASADGNSSVTTQLTDINASGAGRDALSMRATGSSTGSLQVAGFNGIGAGEDGIDVTANDSNVTGFLNNVSVDGAGSNGVILSSTDGSVINLDASQITANTAGANGLRIDSLAAGGLPSAVLLDVTDGSFSGSQASNIVVAANDNSQVDLGLNRVAASGSGFGDGLRAASQTGGDIRINATDLDLNSNNNGNGANLLATGPGSTINLGGVRVAANNNGEDGINVVASGQAAANLTLADSSTNGNLLNGLDIDLNNGGTSNVALIAPFSSTGNLRDGIEYTVTDGSQLTLAADSAVLSDNGRFAVDGQVDGDGSSADLTLTNSLANNGGDGGIRLNVGTLAGVAEQTLVLDNTQVNNTGGNGLSVVVADGSGFTGQVADSSFNGNAVDGVNLVADSATANLSLTDTTMDNNDDDGLDFVGTNFSDVDISALNVSASGNAGSGIEGDSASGTMTAVTLNGVATNGNGEDGVSIAANNSLTVVNHLNSTAIANGDRGLQLSGTNESSVMLNAVASSYLGNADSGVMVFTDDGSAAELCLDATLASGNGANGYELITANDSQVVIEFANGASGNDNDDAGLSVSSSTGSSTYFATTGGLGDFNGNSSAGGNGVEFNLTDQIVAAVNFAGNVTSSANNSAAAGDGVNISIVNAIEAAIQVGNADFGVADLTGNGGDGISLFTSAAAGGLPVNVDQQIGPAGTKLAGTVFNPFLVDSNDVSGSGEFGIVFTTFNTDLAAGTFPLITNNVASNNGRDGIRTEFTDSNIPGDFAIVANTASDNAGFGIAVIQNNTPIGNLVIENNTTTDNQLGGIVVIGDAGSTLSAGSIANNIVQGNGFPGVTMNAAGPIDDGGDGIAIRYTGAAVNNLTISGNESSANAGRGLLLDLVDAPVTNLDISDNGTMIVNRPGLTFNIVGNTLTQPFSLINSSVGFDITNLLLNVAPSNNDFDPDNTAFQPVDMTDVLTGLVSVNGIAITQGTSPLQDAMGEELDGGGVMDEDQMLSLIFNDFNPGEAFQFDLDVDEVGTNSTVLGNELVGSIVTVGFMNGNETETLTGTLTAVDGQTDASQFVAIGATEPGFSGNGDEGVRINAVRSDLTNVLLDNNTIDGNGDDGIEIVLDDSNLTNGAITSNAITDNDGDGIRLVDIDSDQPVELRIANNAIIGNDGQAVNVAATGDNRFEISGGGNTIADNGGGFVFVADEDATFDLVIGDGADGASQFSGNSFNGIAVLVQDNARGTVTVDSVESSGSLANGNGLGDALNITVVDNAILDSVEVIDSVLSNSAGRGFVLDASENTVVASTTVTNTVIDGNTLQGVRIDRRGEAAVDDIVFSGGSISGNGQDGVELNLSGGGTDTRTGGPLVIDTTLLNVAVDDNALNGIELQTTADVQSTLTVGGGTISNNGGSGVRTFANVNSAQDISITGTVFDGNGVDGVFVTANNDTTVGVTIDQAQVVNSGVDGVHLDVSDNVVGTLAITDTNIDTGAGTGLLLNAVGDSLLTAQVADSSVTGFGLDGVTVNTVTSQSATVDFARTEVMDNTGDGIALNNVGSTLSSTMIDVRSDNNGARGLEIQTTGTGATTSVIVDGTVDPQPSNGTAATSTFNGNGSNGILVVNTPAGGMSDTDTTLSVSNSTISGNGAAADATGDDLIGFLALSGTGSNSTLALDVTNNLFSGNTGTDFVTRSFVAATVPAPADPAESGAYQFDPVARLTLNLMDNIGDQIDVTQVGALFDNQADPFKSPGSIFNGNDTRTRSGQRVAADVVGAFVSNVAAVASPTQFTGETNLPVQTGRFDNDFVTFVTGANAGETNDVNVYSGPGVPPDANNVTGTPARLFAFTAADDAFDMPVNTGDQFRVDAVAVAGVGSSTFVTSTATIASGGNNFAIVLSDFDDLVGGGLFTAPAADAAIGPNFEQAFGWTVDPTLANPMYDPVVLGDTVAPLTDMTPAPMPVP